MVLTRQPKRPRERPGGRHNERAAGRWGSLAAVSLATALVIADFMAVSTALPAIHQSTGASFTQLQWVLEGFVLSLAALVLMAGRAGDLAGRRRAFLSGLCLLGSGALAAGLAPSVYGLIGARFVQGIGAALVVATGTALVSQIFVDAKARLALAVWVTVAALASAASPLAGGLVAETLGWRWIFLIEVPIAGIAIVLGAIWLPPRPAGRNAPNAGSAVAGRPGRPDRRGLDWRGLGFFTAAIAILVIGLVRTSASLGGWAQNGALACIACSGLLLVAFIAVEMVAPVPMLDLSLFRRRTFTAGAIGAFGLSASVLGPFMLLVLYLSYDLGCSALGTGLRLLALSAMTALVLPITAVLGRRLRIKWLICCGLGLVAAGLWLMSRLTASGNWVELVPGLVIAGAGFELANPRLALMATLGAQPSQAVVAARANSTFRHLGTAVGIAVLGSIFSARLSNDVKQAIAATPRLLGQAPLIVGAVLEDRAPRASAPADGPLYLTAMVHESFANAMHEVLLVSALVALASAVLALAARSRDLARQGAPGDGP